MHMWGTFWLQEYIFVAADACLSNVFFAVDDLGRYAMPYAGTYNGPPKHCPAVRLNRERKHQWAYIGEFTSLALGGWCPWVS